MIKSNIRKMGNPTFGIKVASNIINLLAFSFNLKIFK